MEILRYTYKEKLSTKGIIEYGLLNNLMVIPCINGKELVVLKKYNVVYHEISGDTKAVSTAKYCLVEKEKVKKDDFFNNFYFVKKNKILAEDTDLNKLLTDKTYSVLTDINILKEVLKYNGAKKEFSYSLILEAYKNNPDFSPTKLKHFIESVLLESIEHIEEAKELKNALQNVEKKEDILYYCFFPKLCYYIHNYEKYDAEIKNSIKTLIKDISDRIQSTDTLKLFTNIDLEILIQASKEKSTQ